MKLCYILSDDYKIIEVCRIGQPRFQLFIKITNIYPEYLKPIEVSIDKELLICEIEEKLEEREKLGMDCPSYGDRFKTEDIFEWKEYKGEQLKLCTSGFDNQIIFLLNILNAINKTNIKLLAVFVDNNKELRDFLASKTC